MNCIALLGEKAFLVGNASGKEGASFIGWDTSDRGLLIYLSSHQRSFYRQPYVDRGLLIPSTIRTSLFPPWRWTAVNGVVSHANVLRLIQSTCLYRRIG